METELNSLAGLCDFLWTPLQNPVIARRDYMNTGYRIGCEGRPTHYNSLKPLLNSSGLLLFGFDGSAGLCNSTEFQNRATIRSQGEYTNTARVVH